MSMVNPLLQSQEPVYYDFELPSKGITYLSNNVINEIFEDGAIVDGVVKVRPLTTKDELIWTDQKLVEDLKAPIIILKNTILGLKKPELLLRADVEALLIKARTLTYGEFTNINWQCSSCNESNEIKYNYNNIQIKRLDSEHDLLLKLKNMDIIINPLVFMEAVEIQKANDSDISEQLDKIVSCIQQIIIHNDDNSTDTVTNKGFIAEWVEQMNPNDFRILLDHFTKVNELGAAMELEVTCQKCDNKELTDIVVDITNFFSEED